MCTIDSELLHQRSHMRRLLRDAHWTGNVTTACITDAMIGDQAVVTTQRRLFQERLEPVGEDAGVHEHDRFARADGSILQLDPFQRRSLPGFRFSLLRAGALPFGSRSCGKHPQRGHENRQQGPARSHGSECLEERDQILSLLVRIFKVENCAAGVAAKIATRPSRIRSIPMAAPAETIDQIRTTVIDLALKFGPKLLAALVILAIGYLVGRQISRWLERALMHLEMEPPVRSLIVRIARVVISLLFVIMAMQNLGVELLPLIAGLGVAGAGIALAMQGLLGNLFAGLSIIFTKPFRVGEYIGIVGEEGKVETITLFQTTLSHPDRSLVVIPNRKIVGEILHNYGKIRQLDITVGVAYDTELNQALTVIQEVLQRERARASGHDACDRRAPAGGLVGQHRGQAVGRAYRTTGRRAARSTRASWRHSASTGSSFRIRSAKCGCFRMPPERPADIP